MNEHITNETKWASAGSMGPRQVKQFNEALSALAIEAQKETLIQDSGTYEVFHLAAFQHNPAYYPLLLELKRKYNATVTPKNYLRIIADIRNNYIPMLKDSRIVRDERSTPEQRVEIERVQREEQQKRYNETGRLAKLDRHYYDLPKTATAIKQVLSTLFPKTTFSVKSDRYAGGSSINTKWTDGPTEKEVQFVVQFFNRAWFDGSDDSTHHIAPLEWDGHIFEFTGKYNSATRNYSLKLLNDCRDRYIRETGETAPEIAGIETNAPYIRRTTEACGWKFVPDTDYLRQYLTDGGLVRDESGRNTADGVIHQMVHYTATEHPAIPYVTDWPQYPENEIEPANSLRQVIFRILLGHHAASRGEAA